VKLALVALLIALPKTKAVVDVPAGWTQLVEPALVIAYQSPSGITLAVTRAQVPSPDAWRAKTRDDYLGRIARGALEAVPGQTQLARRIGDVNGVPTLDLELQRARSTVVVRILVFRTYALALALEVPRGGSLAEARAITRSFAPPPPGP
jgi:hypothetical protein